MEPQNVDTKKPSAGLNFLIDFAPLLIFFLTYRFSDPKDNPVTAIIYGTGAFMVAIVIALIVSKLRLGKISPMLWLSSILIIGFGGLTIYFRNEAFIQLKPTIIYLFFAAIIFGGLLRGKAMLKYLLHAAFEGLTDEGWLKLSRNWGYFFLFLAALNEGMRHFLSFDMWLTLKVWGVSVLSLLFTFTQIPMLLKHGMDLGEEEQGKG